MVTSKLGYPLEKHYYYTEDGYINSIFRIPGKKGTSITKKNEIINKPVVLYQHGLFDCWAGIVTDEESSLGLMLVNAGFDLWMANSRGNRYSRDHQYLDIGKSNDDVRSTYWNFSFDHMAKYD